MSKKLLLASLISMLLAGCNDENIDTSGPIPDVGTGGGSVTPPKPNPEPTPEPIPPTDIIPPVTYVGTLMASGKIVSGDVRCNGISLDENTSTFTVKQGNEFNCSFGAVELGRFKASFPKVKSIDLVNTIVPASFDLQDSKGVNVTKILQSISTCERQDGICLNEINAFDIQDIYLDLDNNESVNEFLKPKEEEATDDVGKAPSSHVDAEIAPVVTPGTSNDLNSGFVSASAEDSYAYKPSSAAQVLTKSKLTDDNGTPLAGVNFFSTNAIGITDDNGEFEYLWGDKLTFSINTFEFGSVTGNQINYKITDVSDNEIVKSNIQSLITRYAENSNNTLLISNRVQEVFSLYPNVINELINLSLPSGGMIEGTQFSIPNEFDAQFEHGLTAAIDAELQPQGSSFYFSDYPHVFAVDSGTYVTDSLTAIFKGVGSFHVFNDNGSFYGATGYTRGMRALNLSNRAFPIMMPRADINKDIPFGQQQAWTREGRPYIAEYPGIDKMPAIPVVSKDNATFGFPFVTAGEIGAGKVVFMGNSMYPSIISCPDNYWANGALRIDSVKKSCTSSFDLANDPRNDNGSMKTFFSNLFTWLNNDKTIKGINVASNIDVATALRSGTSHGTAYDFFVNPSFGFSPSVEMLTKDGFSGHLSASETPLLILQAYPPKPQGDGMSHRFIADLENPNLSQDDITALITYINDGGSVLFMDAIDRITNPEPIGRLADSAGVSLGGSNVTPTSQAFCGSSYYCQAPSPNLHVKSQYEMVVLERFQDVDGKQPYTVTQDGSVEWIKDETKIKFEIPTYEMIKRDDKAQPVLDKNGAPVMETKFARIFVKNEEERAAAISELQTAFTGTPLCSNGYEYEFNCIETRQGDGIEVRGSYGRADFDRYQMSQDVVESMVKAANLGDNFNALMEHELYYRTKGKQGIRLSSVELNQTYDNLSIWMWNDNAYAYDSNVQDELGFKTAVGFLNCYTNNAHGNGLTCPDDLATKLIKNGMIYGEGELVGQMNPSYPLNYMEKPLTRIMLGRSFWDHEITVDTTKYPGRTVASTITETVNIETAGKAVSYSAGNNQSTGLWAPQLSEITINGGVSATITVMMADDLTGKPQHETSLNRPPRMQTSYAYDGTLLTFKVPYGGLIYIKPTEVLSGDSTIASFNLIGVEKAAWWKKDPDSAKGEWINAPESSTAPIAEIDTGSFIYTTALNNVKTADLNEFSYNMNRFANAASDFYGRDEVSEGGQHRRFTYPALKEFRHRFVNDVQISIGAAHSGYPVMSSSFNVDATKPPTNAIDDWLVWHEVGHNLASAPFSVPGSTEVTNNILALYMQELDGRNDKPEMDRIRTSIQKAPIWLSSNDGHAWSQGDAGLRLVMFGQLKIWAESHFKIDDWYVDGDVQPTIYNQDQGWNMVKLMHRKARGDQQGDNGVNYCSSSDTGLNAGDLMMVCSSYVSGYDLRDFFMTWNVGETSVTNADGTKVYSGGISDAGLNALTRLRLDKPEIDPLTINALPN